MHNSIISKLNKRQIFFPIIVTHFWVPTQNQKIQKKMEEIQKTIGARKGCWNAEKWPKLG
jgi:hypothetical protein